MPNPLLRHTGGNLTTSQATYVNTVTVGRALVISKLTVAANAACSVSVYCAGYPILNALPMTAGQVWSESGLVVVAGESLTAVTTVASSAYINIFGEEVDN
jgi:hypothetical protein